MKLKFYFIAKNVAQLFQIKKKELLIKLKAIAVIYRKIVGLPKNKHNHIKKSRGFN